MKYFDNGLFFLFLSLCFVYNNRMSVKNYYIGMDVGSTTVKVVLLEDGQIIFSNYVRHFSEIRETLLNQLKTIRDRFGNIACRIALTGSAGFGLAQKGNLPFVQEVHAAHIAVRKFYPEADAVIELGGEDAKIIFLTGGVEERMNGSCAGGTGAFIDQMATLLGVTVKELDDLSLRAEKIYPIASRCGVFAKSDIQPLINQGAKKEDIAASIFQAVVDQTVSGLAQGRKIRGNVLFLGGPLSFIQGLRNAFVRTLKLSDEQAIFPETGPIFMALGAAIYAGKSSDESPVSKMISAIENTPVGGDILTTLPLFESEEDYRSFCERHRRQDVAYGDLSAYRGKAYLGIDAGSTTTKLTLIGECNELLYHYYVSNKGQPLDIIIEQLEKIYRSSHPDLKIVSSAVTGYGEELIRAGMGVDFGIVETIAHFKAASYFCPDVDFIIDIGGQDIKCFKIKNHAIDSIILNEACSSGCGSFIQAFAEALNYSVADFAKLGLFAKHPVDLGSRCTVFMNSSVKQAQKDGAGIDDISAGLSQSVIKNAIYKVIRAHSANELGKNIVAQGGTFLNDAVLRSFEKELNHDVIRPQISELMGAFGAALYAKEHSLTASGLISREHLKDFSFRSTSSICRGCTAHCNLNIIQFAGGKRFISGNRCDKVSSRAQAEEGPSVYDWKLERIQNYRGRAKTESKGRVGFPLALNFYDQLPFFATLFNELGFEVVVSDVSTRQTYFQGQHTIASDTVCYPAKLMHGHIENLLEKSVDFIFYPCQTYNLDEGDSDNHFNCPVVAYYPETLKGNMDALNERNFLSPYLDLNNPSQVKKAIYDRLKPYGVSKKDISSAVEKGYVELKNYREMLRKETERCIAEARERHLPIIVLAGRPYHVDPEINHGIARYIASLGICVITEDALSLMSATPEMSILNQWTYHSRMFKAAEYVLRQPDMQLVQLVSFGCGIDAITTDELRRILEGGGKLYTQLKIDEINNLGALKIRIRSLLAAMEETGKVGV